MATAVTYVGNSYSIPAYGDTGYAQGAGNLSLYLVALATGSLTLSGGSFPLTADANFDGSFGLVALYLKSVTATIATTGFLRMARADVIAWRNAANSGNLPLGVDASNNLTFNGNVISGSGGDIGPLPAGTGIVLTSPDGTKTLRISLDNNAEVQYLELT